MPYAPPKQRTNTLAIVSFVASILNFVQCFFVGSIVAIITGHIARRQIKRTGEQGNGWALAGLIIGYVGVALTILGITGFLVFVFGFSPGISQTMARDDARKYASAIERDASFSGTSPRNPEQLLQTYRNEHDGFGCCTSADIHLPDGTPISEATLSDYQRAQWRIELSRTLFQTRYACIALPESPDLAPTVTKGHCPAS